MNNFSTKSSRPAIDAYAFITGELCGPPQYRRFTCARCHETKAVLRTHGPRRYCKECKSGVAKFAGAAVGKVARAIVKGELLHPSRHYCVDCGRTAEVYDHRDYSKPLEVDPVCLSCNVRRGPATWKAA